MNTHPRPTVATATAVITNVLAAALLFPLVAACGDTTAAANEGDTTTTGEDSETDTDTDIASVTGDADSATVDAMWADLIGCGNGRVDSGRGEECDHGPAGSYACDPDCTLAECGDGLVNPAALEVCDDGNDANGDGCADDCVRELRMFVTSETHSGAFGGTAGAHAKCQQAAKQAQLTASDASGKDANADRSHETATFQAWLASTESDSPKATLGGDAAAAAERTRYVLVNGTPVADGWTGLTTPPHRAAIVLDEHGHDLSADVTSVDVRVWTNVAAHGGEGGVFVDADCNGWTTQQPDVQGNIGYMTLTDQAWTIAGAATCSGVAHLYCIEVAE